MKFESLVSIIVTSYNNGDYLHQCLESVHAQTYRNIEVVVVDDGSTDNTRSIVQEMSARFDKLRYYWQENSGVSAARNLGISKAHGEYVMFVDGDDYLDSEIVSELIKNITTSTDIACCCCRAFDEKGAYVDHFFSSDFTASALEEKEKLFLQLLNGRVGKPDGRGYTAIGVPWGKLYRIAFIKDNGIWFNTHLRRMQDNMFNMYAFWAARSVVYINAPLYYYRLSHIQSKNLTYGFNVWQPFLAARNEFYKEHEDILTNEVERAVYYELNIAFVSTTLDVVYRYRFRDAVRKLSVLRTQEEFKPLFDRRFEKGMPLKMEVFRILSKLRLYGCVVVIIKLTNLLKR